MNTMILKTIVLASVTSERILARVRILEDNVTSLRKDLVRVHVHESKLNLVVSRFTNKGYFEPFLAPFCKMLGSLISVKI